jgi:hypothetical protein
LEYDKKTSPKLTYLADSSDGDPDGFPDGAPSVFCVRFRCAFLPLADYVVVAEGLETTFFHPTPPNGPTPSQTLFNRFL